MIKRELQSLWNNKLLLLVFIVLLIIPAMYAGIFLSSMWDPYGEIEYLPVAVVNKDKSVTYNDKRLSVGKDLAEELEDSDSMAFNVVSEEVAKRGLVNGTYYMVITIPEDFSKNATTLMDDKPKQMILNYETNPGKNYIAMKMGQSAVKEIKANITTEVTKTYAEGVFDNLKEIGDGFDDAVEGTDKMLDGEKKLSDGNKKITTNLNTLASSSLTFKNGAETLNKGLKTYTDGVASVDKNLKTVQSGLKKVNNGVDQLDSGSGKILKGLTTMQKSINGSLTDKNVSDMKAAAEGLKTIDGGIQEINKKVQAGLTEKSLNNLAGLSTTLEKGVGENLKSSGKSLGKEVGVAKNLGDAGGKLKNTAGLLVGKYAETGKEEDMGGADYDIRYANKVLEGLSASPNLTPEQKAMLSAAISKNESAITSIETATKTVGAAGSDLESAGANLTNAGTTLDAAGKVLEKMQESGLDSKATAEQLKELKAGIAQLASKDAHAALLGSNKAINSLLGGMQTVQTGLNMTEAKDGSSGLVEGMTILDNGITSLKNTGTVPLETGVTKLINQGTKKLVTNNNVLMSGMAKLTTGASKISDGSGKLADGSKTVGEGLTELTDGTKEMNTKLSDGAKEIKDNEGTDDTITMFSEPVDTTSQEITTVKNNGHAMAAYMMSVGLWVGALAFCLIYPLTEYHGKLKNGLSWWASKAVIIYPLAAVMAGILMAVMHSALGFDPQSMPKTFVSAVVAAIAFMSIMYFFNALLGKVGSFLMLVFMVLQLAGCAGTYPVQISGKMVPKIHDYLPFTYSVEAFRSAISGGTSIRGYLITLILLAVVFSVLTIILFLYRGKRIKEGKRIIYTWIEEKGLA